MADATRIEKTITELPSRASQALGTRIDDPSNLLPGGDGAAAVPPQLPQAIERLSQEVQALPQAVKKAPGELAPVEAYLEAKLPMIDALPLPDFFFGGGVLVAVVILQAIGLRLLTGHFEKRAQHIQQRPAWWSVDVLLGFTVFRMLGLHLMSIVLWSAALVYSGIIPQWAAAARFAALSYTTLGSHRELSDEWYMLSPIIAISGMFTFAWTASVLVSIVGRCNELRGVVRDARRAKRGATTRSTRSTTAPGEATAAERGDERTADS